MSRPRRLLAVLWSAACWLAKALQMVSKLVAALMILATFVVLAMHFLHVEVNPSIPDVWPIFEPSGLPSVSDMWERIHA